jgi:benzoyl-CoA reductase/2-hydroxyglutaryl-CoA dehydratase subunit BcrC/BadD/HgdB
MNDFVDLECEMILCNNVIFDMPKKQTESSQYQISERNYQKISQLKDTFRFLSPATNTLHDSIEKANKESKFKYNACQLKETQKNFIETVDHILNNKIVQEYHAAAKYVAETGRKMQEIKEEFTKEVISIVGSKIGKDNELCFQSFKNKKTKQVQKRHKGISG